MAIINEPLPGTDYSKIKSKLVDWTKQTLDEFDKSEFDCVRVTGFPNEDDIETFGDFEPWIARFRNAIMKYDYEMYVVMRGFSLFLLKGERELEHPYIWGEYQDKISARTFGALKKNSIKTLEELIKQPKFHYARVSNGMGPSTIKELAKLVRKHNLTWPEEWADVRREQ